MPTKPATHGEVKSICDSLECSPSQHQATSPVYVGSHDNPHAKSTQSPKASANKATEKELGHVGHTPAAGKKSAKGRRTMPGY